MKSTKRRNRSIERTKKGVSAGDRASVSEYWSICVSKVSLALGAPWVLAELESSVSQSKQQFWILAFMLMMIKKPPIYGPGFWHRGLPVVVLGERMVLPRAGMEPRVGSHREGCATLPWSEGHVLYPWALV